MLYEVITKAGEVIGLIGLNGSGKSTMLKIVSGILKPSSGKVTTNGSISPLIELGAGFDMDLTARENVFLNGYVLGYSKATMLEKYDEIIEFSELRDFQDVAIKNFSSGMIARLGFSIATITRPDILRITSYNVCYTKLLRMPEASGARGRCADLGA